MIRLLPPAIILYTEDLPDGVGGRAYGPVVLIREKYETDVGLHEHELTHVTQWWITLGLHPLLYLFRPYRLWAEARAYREQTQYPASDGHFMTVDEAAVLLADARYDLGLTIDDARTQLFIS